MLDLDQPLLRDKLALRLALLDRRNRFQQEQAFDNDKRYYATLAARPFRRTTLRASFGVLCGLGSGKWSLR